MNCLISHHTTTLSRPGGKSVCHSAELGKKSFVLDCLRCFAFRTLLKDLHKQQVTFGAGQCPETHLCCVKASESPDIIIPQCPLHHTCPKATGSGCCCFAH